MTTLIHEDNKKTIDNLSSMRKSKKKFNSTIKKSIFSTLFNSRVEMIRNLSYVCGLTPVRINPINYVAEQFGLDSVLKLKIKVRYAQTFVKINLKFI